MPDWATSARGDAVLDLLAERERHQDRWQARKARGIARAADFSWSHYAATLAALYQDVAARATAATA
jgi:hypothetical protein